MGAGSRAPVNRVARGAMLALALAVFRGAPASAAEHPILGKRLLVTDPTGDPAHRKILGLGKEGPASVQAIVGDPVVDGASLRIVLHGGTGSDETFDLPANGWRPIGSLGFRYSSGASGG